MLSELDLQLQMDKHNELCSFDVEYLEEPVKPVIHNIPKLLFFIEGTGKIRIYNKEFDISDYNISCSTYIDKTENKYYVFTYSPQVLNPHRRGGHGIIEVHINAKTHEIKSHFSR